MRQEGRTVFSFLVVWLVLFLTAPVQAVPLTPLEGSGYMRLSSTGEISEFLVTLTHEDSPAQIVRMGESSRGSPLEALLVSEEMNLFSSGRSSKMTVMLIGSQHGTEPSGAEALLLIAREIVVGRLRSYPRDMNLIVIPNSNPDGRDLRHRGNGNGVNLSTNFTVLSEPESKALNDMMFKWKPEVILDVHESAILKKKSLAKQGYVTDFEAQFEVTNNPNVDRQIRSVSLELLLPEMISLVRAQGLPAQRYIGEITDIRQPVTHGGLSIRNLRNKGGMMGSFSFLLENRLDPSKGSYPTPSNIRERVAKQYLCISAFLQCCHVHRDEIIRTSRYAREKWRDPENEEPLYLVSRYVADQSQPSVAVTLRKLDTGEPVEHIFAYHGAVVNEFPLVIPPAYIVSNHQPVLREILDRHHIRYHVETRAATAPVTIQRILSREVVRIDRPGSGYAEYSVSERQEVHAMSEEDLWIPLDQPAGRLVPLLLELRSISSIFSHPTYSHRIVVGQDFFVHRVNRTD